MFVLTIRFFVYGWIHKYFIEPQFFFSTFNLSFIKPLSGSGMYVIFTILLLLSLGIILGFFYRFCIISFFILFTYFNLIDKTTYLNHYYLVSLLCFILIFLPAHRFYSFDVIRTKKVLFRIEYWKVFILKLQLGFVYFFGSIAKWKSDWLIEAQPLKIWLLSVSHTPIIGDLLSYNLTAYLFSYIGLIFDFSIFFFLLYKKTRLIAYFFVLIFHILTWILFPIGMFPWLMIFLTSIFFSVYWHKKFLYFLKKSTAKIFFTNISFNVEKRRYSHFSLIFFGFFFLIQTFFIFRHHLIDNDICWSEEGFRYSWHIMIIHKTAEIEFFVYDYKKKTKIPIEHKIYLTDRQNYMLVSQPDMILQFAHYLKKVKSKELNNKNIGIMVESIASINGHPSQYMIKPNLDLSKIKYKPFSLEASNYITSFNH